MISILYVDSREDFRRMVESALGGRYQVHTAPDALTAWYRCREVKPDVMWISNLKHNIDIHNIDIIDWISYIRGLYPTTRVAIQFPDELIIIFRIKYR